MSPARCQSRLCSNQRGETSGARPRRGSIRPRSGRRRARLGDRRRGWRHWVTVGSDHRDDTAYASPYSSCRAAVILTGWSPSRLAGRPFELCFPARTPVRCDAGKTRLTGRVQRFGTRVVRSSDVRARPLHRNPPRQHSAGDRPRPVSIAAPAPRLSRPRSSTWLPARGRAAQ